MTIARIAAAAAVFLLLAGCGGGGGGGGASGPVAPPPSPPPPSGPQVIGESPSGGTVDSNSVYAGDFRGPSSQLAINASNATTLTVLGKTTAGAGNDVSVDVVTTAGVPTVTLVLPSGSAAFNFAGAQTASYEGGFLGERTVLLSAGGLNWDASLYDFTFNGQTREHSQLLVYHSAAVLGDPPLASGAVSFGADEVAMPSSGSATFDTGLVGFYLASPAAGDLEQFIGRATTSVNFTSGAVSASFADVDFIGAGGAMTETSTGGIEFGLNMAATISGDDFAGTMTTTGATAMTGPVQGDFYGPLNLTPNEIGGAFAIQGAGGAAFGGIQGVCTCITGGP